MGFFNWLANGLGTLIGVVTEAVSSSTLEARRSVTLRRVIMVGTFGRGEHDSQCTAGGLSLFA